MPVYEYKCKNCFNIFEIFKPVSKIEDKEKCPNCGSHETERLLSLFSKSVIKCHSTFTSTG